MISRIPGTLSIAVLILSCFSAAAQSQNDPPGKMVLLPGYQHERLAGIDTLVGRIWKDNGLSIRYDIGALAGNQISNNPNLQWSREQMVSGKRMQVGMTKNRLLIIVFSAPVAAAPAISRDSPANFYATVTSDEDIADMILMVMTYMPS
jgi:hypothetical protein